MSYKTVIFMTLPLQEGTLPDSQTPNCNKVFLVVAIVSCPNRISLTLMHHKVKPFSPFSSNYDEEMLQWWCPYVGAI